ncbi:hypothetical protein [Mucilaginibacter humi]|uniref:hypothetical protein n=1 Tax=Mucilaginibacter humi TaxID=2732510 RepID=UPI001FE9371A|nr:hypothetical protein [Mucilaginibacter humi]
MPGGPELDSVRLAMWASEPIPFDPMEIALHEAYAGLCNRDERPDYRMVHEYPTGGQPPMMTHLFENKSGERIIAAKGAPEALLAVCDLTETQKTQIGVAINAMADKGYRLLAVGEAAFSGSNFPARQQQFRFTFKGLVGFYDPPKKIYRRCCKGSIWPGSE